MSTFRYYCTKLFIPGNRILGLHEGLYPPENTEIGKLTLFLTINFMNILQSDFAKKVHVGQYDLRF